MTEVAPQPTGARRQGHYGTLALEENVNKQHASPESIIKALNQLSQTIEAMAIVVNRLKRSVEHDSNQAAVAAAEADQHCDRKLH
ncbi:hypothetical protein FKG94_04405 [Exilibacterium tricleocarpae]|uniref:Uncharacterized protein n=1 Tax=Exilibacterium tricleocarpae TaxID=2591008 RepID=A0A545U5L9_9GAMM|nr:hypothetical protein [Exilibacterium tricleocarpae]TQV84768.1 hypothetical protein FKG94_04405 [Exilibacterium tricleocarpae]